MLIGRKLLKDKGILLDQVSHQNVQELLTVLEDNQAQYHADAVQALKNALTACYGDRPVSFAPAVVGDLQARRPAGNARRLLADEGLNGSD